VATTGNDLNPGTQSQPWQTIQKAANSMVAGDTVIVTAGNYAAQRVAITHSGNNLSQITFQAQGNVILHGGFSIRADFITIRGF
jgi:hypothetical protein